MYTDREVAIRYRMALEGIQAWNNANSKSEFLKNIIVESLRYDIPKPETVDNRPIIGEYNGKPVKEFPPGARAGQY